MDTITIESTQEGVPNISYTSAEVLRFIEKAKLIDDYSANLTNTYKEIRDIKNKVRDFFSEVEWEDGEQTVSKSDVNDLLESIGSNKLTTKYNAKLTITGTFSIEVEDEDEVESMFTDNVNVDFYGGDIDVDQIEVNDIEEDN